MSDPGPWADLPGLLHDARLLSLGWDPALARLTLVLDSLRPDVDGGARRRPSGRGGTRAS